MTAPATMEALLVEALPEDDGWAFEPKWDGFRCVAVREGDAVALWSRSGKPLGRYFPEIVAQIEALAGGDVTLDGELVVPTARGLDFDALSQRLHPAESRIRRLAAETPARLIVFDLLALADEDLRGLPLASRRSRLERFAGKAGFLLSPQTVDRDVARHWLDRAGGALDGVVAKRLDQPYRAGERAMLKVKRIRTADCVVGGYRTGGRAGEVASLLLGLHDDDGLLHHVGFCASFTAAERRAWAAELAPLEGGLGFTGNAPDKASRWARGKDVSWIPLRPELVVEVGFDQVTSGRFRHAAKLLRRRPDKRPHQCRCDQLAAPTALTDLSRLLGSALAGE